MKKSLEPTADQLEMQALVQSMKTDERELSPSQVALLAPFIEKTRDELVEINDNGRRGMRRVDYYHLNERGLKMLQMWDWGLLDSQVKPPRKS